MKLKSMKHAIWIFSFIFIVESIVFADLYKLIRNPEPTVVEGDPVHLKEIASIQEDLGNGEFLFFPRTIAVGKSGLLIYDVSQAKILNLDNRLKPVNSWGRKGNGPGEFSGSRYSMFEMSFGEDGNIYANDPRAYRIQGFDINGKPLRTVRYTKRWKTKRPLVDKNGNILFATIQGNKVKVFNEKNDCLIQIPLKDEYVSYLYHLPDTLYRRSNILEGYYGIELRYAGKSTLLVYFKDSATMAIISPGSEIKTLKLWPKNALIRYKTDLGELREEKPTERRSKGHRSFGTRPHKSLFRAPFIDQDNNEFFYLQLATKYENGKIPVYLYQFNLNGDLKKIYHFPLNKQESKSIRFLAKRGNQFYAISDSEAIKIFQEDTR